MNRATEVSSRKENSTGDWQREVIRPAVDIFENANGITLKADMPGVSKERLEIRVEGNNLRVEGTIGIEAQSEMSALYADLRATTYRRSFAIGNELETEKIDASLADGVLTLRIPKRAELRPRRIEIKG
ncbi:Hsp20/alpha crystallin family protein [Steroidobacter flavus]|uniref:Hsp20/alpha crystallin family protein n=1 Tax=Steroidobacter flavus TaxID=1842136 RepID=A0ABV8SQR8_9GAMM